jgi:hypothetical protein
MKRHLIAGLPVITLALAAAGWGSSLPASASASPPAGNAKMVSSADVGQLQEYVRQHAGQYAGLYVDTAAGTLTVNVAAATASQGQQQLHQRISSLPAHAARASVPSSMPSKLAVSVRRVRYSQQQLAATMTEVTERQPWSALVKPVLASWGMDPRTDTVRVGLTRITPQMRAAARAAFGDRVTLVQQARLNLATSVTNLHAGYRAVSAASGHKGPGYAGTGQGNAPAAPQVAPQPSRLLDETPYFGGDRIYRLISSGGVTTLIQCTVAFMWSPTAMSSAGHCGPTGTVWSQGYYDPSNNTLYKTGNMGTVYTTQWGNGRIDAELMNNSSWAPDVYTSLQGASPVVGYETGAVGETVCTDGSFTGENCTAVIQDIDVCENEGDPLTGATVNVCHLDIATSSNGSMLCQPGDSGGPVYSYSGNSLLADGIISGCSSDTPPGGSLVAYSDILEAQLILGGTIATS